MNTQNTNSNTDIDLTADLPLDLPSVARHAFQRNASTGMIEGMVYPTRADGRIDWVKLIPKDQIVFNTSPKLADEILRTYGKSANNLKYSEVVESGVDVSSKHILVLLMGFMELAAIRGYSSTGRIAHALSYPPEAAISVCECNIDWIPNVEEPSGFRSYGTADATVENTGGWGYLSAIAGNRAFVRAVKQGLRIPILGFDEIAKKDSAIPESSSSSASNSEPTLSQTSPSGSLQRHAIDSNPPISFESIKKGATTKYRQRIEGDPELWQGWADISPRDCWALITIVKESDTERKGLKAKK